MPVQAAIHPFSIAVPAPFIQAVLLTVTITAARIIRQAPLVFKHQVEKTERLA
jgi:hypothetical protein